MNPAQWHLAINHLPTLGAPLAALLLAWGMWRRSRELLRAALGFAVVLSIATWFVVQSGERAEEYVEDAAWFEEPIVHDHEEHAELALKIMLVAGLISAVALWQLRGEREVGRVWPATALAALLVSSGFIGWAALKGGEIRHTEVRPGATVPMGGEGEEAGTTGEASSEHDGAGDEDGGADDES